MLKYARLGVQFRDGLTYQGFMDDAKSQAACLHCIRTVGEAATCLPKEFIDRYPEVKWAVIIGMRQRLTHGYDNIKWPIVWEVLQEELPTLIPQLERILTEYPEDPA